MPTFSYYLRRLKELGVREGTQQALEVLTGKTYALWEEMCDRYIRSHLSQRALLKLLGFSSAQDLLEHFRTRKTPAFFFDNTLATRIDEFRSLFPDQAEQIIQKADLVMEHKLDLLGSRCTDLNAVGKAFEAEGYLPWHMDFESGASWSPRTHSLRIRYGDRPGVDVKVPWQLSRFQHLIPLGQAYQLTQNERYTEEFVQQVTNWIDLNPCPYGVNWSCTMEAGIRAVNWIWAFQLFKNSQQIDGKFLLSFLTSLHTHAQFIRNHLEYREAWVAGQRRRLNSNHYLSDLIGLLYVAVLFPEFKLAEDASVWAAELETELFAQTMPDGTDYEHSTSYHRLVLEIFLSGLLLLKLNGIPMSSAVRERIERMAEFVADYLRPDGSSPQIGDSDDGRLHPLSIRDHSDHRYLPLMAAELFGRGDLRLWNRDPEVWWWWGKSVQERSCTTRGSVAYASSGFYIMRGSNIHMFISAATIGMHGFGSHSHNDLLSFEYCYKDRPWIVDPGTYVYTSDPQARNLFRSTKSHNTVQIDCEEINRFDPSQLFQMGDDARVILHEWTSEEHRDVLDVEHTGYARLKQPVRHRRRFQLQKPSGTLVIQDSFEGSGCHLFEWFFHLDPAVAVQQNGSGFVFDSGGQSLALGTSSALQSEITEGWYSPSYGVRQRALVIVLRLTAPVPLSMTITIGVSNQC